MYLIRTQSSHSTKLWCRRTSLLVCAYFEKFDIAYFKKNTSCFKPINSLSQNMAYFTVRKNLLESSKFLPSLTKFLLLFQKKDFLFQAKVCLGRFFVIFYQTNC